MQQIARKVSCINHSKRHQNASIIDNQNVMNNETGTCDHEKRTDRTHKYEFSKLTIVSCLWSPTGVIRVMLLPKIVLLYRVLVSRDLNNGKKWCTCIKGIWTGYIIIKSGIHFEHSVLEKNCNIGFVEIKSFI